MKRYQNDHPTGDEFYYMNEAAHGDWVLWEEVKKYLEELSGLLFMAQATENWEDVREVIGQIMVDTTEHKERTK